MQKVQEYAQALKNKATIEFVDKSLDPAFISKQIESAMPSQLDAEKKLGAPKSKMKLIDQTKPKEENKK